MNAIQLGSGNRQKHENGSNHDSDRKNLKSELEINISIWSIERASHQSTAQITFSWAPQGQNSGSRSGTKLFLNS